MSAKTWKQKVDLEKNKVDNEIEFFKMKRIYKSKTSGSWKDKVIRDNASGCYHVMGKDTTGKTAWYFISVSKNKISKFLRHKQGDSYDLKDYGEVIASGYGDEVPDDVKSMLKEKYDFDNF
jgi:hypothetical protein